MTHGPNLDTTTTSDVPPAFLVLPEAGDRTVAKLHHKVRAIALKQLMTWPASGLSPAFRRVLADTRRVLSRVLQTHKPLLLEAIANPDVQTPLLVLDVGPALTGQDPESLLKAALPPLMATLAHLAPRGVVPEAILYDLPVEVLADSVGHRLFRFDPPARGLLVDPLGLEVNLHDETKVRIPTGSKAPELPAGMTMERPFHLLHPELPRLEFALYDSNPLSMYEAHPDKWGNAISLGDKSLDHWLGAFREALDIVKVALPDWFEEMKTSMRRIIPVGYLPERHLSASYREAPGIAYLTLCDTPITIAEALVHETQHTKVNLLSWIDPVVHNGQTCWTQSPVRPDLRPLWGVLLAAHAFVPVAAMYDRLAAMGHPVSLTERFPRRRAEILRGNDNGMRAVLDNADASAAGRKLIDEMATVHDLLMAKAPPPPPGMELGADVLPDS